ncbi:MAG: RHS repeat domain-containing protein [Planctomycetota bacterium]
MPTSTLTGPFCCNHQYSVTAITTSAGAISERYAYTAYGQPTILNASGTPLSPQTSTLNSRYSYTGREWDATLGLHHFRARWMSPSAGRFLGRDPIGYRGSPFDLFEFLESHPSTAIDPYGTACSQPPTLNPIVCVPLCILEAAQACGEDVACQLGYTYMCIFTRCFPQPPQPPKKPCMSVSNYNGGENGPQIPVPPDYNPNGPPGQQGTWPEDLQVSCGIGCIACNQNTSTPAANCQGCCNACFPQPSGIFPLIKWSNAIKACKTACLAAGGL